MEAHEAAQLDVQPLAALLAGLKVVDIRSTNQQQTNRLQIVDMIYEFLSANRLSLGGAMDAIIAAKRIEMSKKVGWEARRVPGSPWVGVESA